MNTPTKALGIGGTVAAAVVATMLALAPAPVNTVSLAWNTGVGYAQINPAGAAGYAWAYLQCCRNAGGPFTNAFPFVMNGETVTNNFTFTNRTMFFRLAWNPATVDYPPFFSP